MTGYQIQKLDLPLVYHQQLIQVVLSRNWLELDTMMKRWTSRPELDEGGFLFNFLQKYAEFDSIEFIISIRNGEDDFEEDGIWHDDGSRAFAFSLSLTLALDELEGGFLGIRKKGQEAFEIIRTPEFGSMILFLTGTSGYEHKIHRVTKGERVVVAGWCSLA
jgi:hypothetical protein